MTEHVSAPPFAHTSGPHDARVVFVGEAFGEQEERLRLPLVGASGRLLFQMLNETWGPSALLTRALATHDENEWLRLREEWLHEESVLLTNTFALRPPGNNLAHLCAAKSELPNDYRLPQIRTENPRFVRPMFLSELRRLAREIEFFPRNLVVPLGASACWACVGSAAIGTLRGAVAELAFVLGGDIRVGDGLRAGRMDEPFVRDLGGSKLPRAAGESTSASETASAPRAKCLPTYHPAAILRAWHWRPIVLADLLKARREREFAEIRRPRRVVLVNPTIEQVESWTRETLTRARLLSPDIETLNGQIRCIGFARSASDSLVIPFIHELNGRSYWPDIETELRAWTCTRALLESDIPKVGQNFLFDLQYLSRAGIRPRNCLHDTMLLHHVLYPEMNKGLGFLASVYSNEFAYKLLRRHNEELKRDE